MFLMINFSRQQMVLSAVLLAMVASPPAAAQTREQCNAILLGIQAGNTASMASLEQAKALNIYNLEVAALVDRVGRQYPADPDLKTSLKAIYDQLDAVFEALQKDTQERAAQMLSALDVVEAICHR